MKALRSLLLCSLFICSVLNRTPVRAQTAPPARYVDAAGGTTTRVSVASDGSQANDATRSPSISADGRYVAFVSEADNLVPDDTNDLPDIFVHDRETGQTTRVSVASDGNQADNISVLPSISADGRYVAFFSVASNLVPDDTNDLPDVFVHDREREQTTCVSVASDGSQANGAPVGPFLEFPPSISADGRYVAFASGASNLVPDDTNDSSDVFVHDRETGQTTRVSVASDGSQADKDSFFHSLSADGRYVAFLSVADNLVPGDTNDSSDIFVHDRETGQTSRVSVASDGSQGNENSGNPIFYSPLSISADGRYVAFVSTADNLVPGDTNHRLDIFVHDRETGQTTRVSVASDGGQADAISAALSLSADGRYVVFVSDADNLVIGDTNDRGDIFVHDRETGQTSRVSVASDGNQADAIASPPVLSADGNYVAFASGASNLVPDDTNGKVDVFVHELGNSSPAPDLYDLIWHDQRPAGDLNPIQLPRQGQETVEVVFKSAGPDFAPADLVLYLRKDPLGASSPSPGGPHDSYFHAPLWDAGEDIDNETYYPVATAESAGQAADGAPLYRFTFSLSGNDCTTETCPPCPTPEACQHRLEAYGIPTHYYREDFGVRRRGSDGWLTAPAGKGANPDGYANAWYHIELTEKPDPPPEHESAEPPPGDTGANGRIAFTSKRDGNNEIYVINADGSGLTNLTNHPGNDTGAAWSPDGTRIAFVSDRHGTSDIYVMNADGSEQTRLTSSHYSEIHPAWSPDGTRIAFVYHYGNDEIYVMNADGSGETPLTENEAFVVDSFPAWSPDGTRIAFQRSPLGDTEIYVINTDGTGLMNLTNHPDEDFFGLSWSPDGRRIAFTSDRDRNSEIYVMNADGSAQTRLTNNSLWDSSPTWSPDGQHLAFMSHRNDNYDIYVMNADGSGQVRLTDNPARDSWPDWSPALSSPDAYTCPRTPIVLVPGYYASAYPWTGQPGWTIRAAGVYQRLEVALFERGYQRDQGFFIAFYDWTQSNDVSANTQLRPVIQRALDKNPGCDKVHIIAHSNGGLVSRALVQNETASHVDTLIMIATPNHGITSAYPAWAGGEVGLEDPAIRWLLLLLMCQHHPSWCANSRPISDQAVWAFIHEEPGLESLGQLLPTRPFLTPNGRKEAIPIRELAADDRNDFLIELNENIQDLTDDTEAVYIIAGTGQETDAAIRVGEPGPAPYWPNGRPVGYPTAPIPVFVGDGDGRVLLSSALLPGISHQTIPDGHTSIVGNDATLQYIFEWLDLGAPVLPEPVPAPTPQEALVAELASPAHLLFTDPQGRRIGFDATSTFFDEIPNATYVGEGNEPKLVYIPDPLEGDYDVQVIGIGNGVYHLFGGTQNSDEFLMVDTGTTSPGKVEQHTAAYVPTGPPPSPEQIIGEWPAASPTGSLTLRNYLTGGALVCGGLFTLLLLAGVLVVRRWRRRPADSAVTTPPPGPVPPAPPVPDVAQGDHLLRKGIAQIKAGDAMEGYRTLRRLIEHSPRDAEAWLWIGWAATQTGDHRAAERCFLRAQQLGHPKAERALEWLNR